MSIQPAKERKTRNGRGSGDRVSFAPKSSPLPVPVGGGPTAASSIARHPWRRAPFLWFLLPALIGYGILFIYPTIRAFYLSLFNWSGLGPLGDPVGLTNFSQLLQNG